MALAFLVIVAVVVSLLALVLAGYFLAYFQSEEDRNTAYVPKIVVVFGLWMTMMSILLLPFDVAARTEGRDLRIDSLWEAAYMIIAILIILIIPFTILYYEALDEDPQAKRKSQLVSALKTWIVFVAISAFVLGMMYGFLGYARIPVTARAPVGDRGYMFLVKSQSNFTLVERSLVRDLACGLKKIGSCASSDFTVKFRVSFPIYVIGFLAFVGWWFFALFGGIGLVALPMDMIAAFRGRPRRIDLQEYARQKISLRERCLKLIDIGKKFESEGRDLRKGRKNKRLSNKYRAAVYFLEEDWTKLKTSYKGKGGNILIAWGHLALGCVGGVLTLLWLLHIILFMLPSPPVNGFLNRILNAMDESVSFFGVVFYGLFVFYLLWCAIKGDTKFGLRFFIVSIHPMKIGDTMMSSFLVNTGLLLLVSVAVTQFSSQAFKLYARLTDADLIIGTQVEYLDFFKEFWGHNVFVIMLLCFAGLSLIYLALKPRDRTKEEEIDEEEEKARRRALKL